MRTAASGGPDQVRDREPVFAGRRPACAQPPLVRLQVLRTDAAHGPEQDAAELARVDRVVDRGRAHAEPLRDRGDGQEALGSHELRPPQIRRNLLRGGVSIRSIGWIRWQAFDGLARVDPRGFEPATPWSRTCDRICPRRGRGRQALANPRRHCLPDSEGRDSNRETDGSRPSSFTVRDSAAVVWLVRREASSGWRQACAGGLKWPGSRAGASARLRPEGAVTRFWQAGTLAQANEGAVRAEIRCSES